MKKLVSLTLALLMALLALLPAMAEGPYTIRSGVLSMLNVNEAEMVNYKNARNLISIQLAKEGLLTHKVRQLHEKAGILWGCCSEVLFTQTLICGSHLIRTLWERNFVLLLFVIAFTESIVALFQCDVNRNTEKTSFNLNQLKSMFVHIV